MWERWKGFWRWYWYHLKRAFWPFGIKDEKQGFLRDEWNRIKSPLIVSAVNHLIFVVLLAVVAFFSYLSYLQHK